MQRFLIATDLDGTILPTIRELLPRAARALRAAADQGHVVMIATARPPSLAEWVYREIGLSTPLGLMNGAYLYHPLDAGYPTLEYLIDARIMQSFLRSLVAQDAIANAFIQYRDVFYMTTQPKEGYFQEVASRCDSRLFSADDPPDTPCGRLLLHSPRPELVEAEAAKLSGATLHRFPSRPNDINARYCLCAPQADKWTHVWHVAQEHGIPRDNIYTFGDESNDTRMLAEAGHGYALLGSMAEAYTPLRTPAPCEEDGVALVIEREILPG